MGIISKYNNMDIKGIVFLFSIVTIVSCYSESAPYTVVKDHGTWQERNYPPTRWVSTQGMDSSPFDGSEPSKAFRRLFEYIDGGNSEDVKIPMTAPVSTRIVPGYGAKSNFTRSFYVPSSFQEGTPTPMNSLVYLEDRPEMNFVTKNFTGFPSEDDYLMQIDELYMLALFEGIYPKVISQWTAGYSGPSVIINRRNEVWLEV